MILNKLFGSSSVLNLGLQVTGIGDHHHHHLLGFDLSSFWHKLSRVEDTVGVNKKSGTKGSIVVVVLSFQLRFPLSEKTSISLAWRKCASLLLGRGGLWHSRWKVITDNGAISLQANLTPANQCQPGARP